MLIAVFGATSPTGLSMCVQAMAAGHEVRAVSRRATDLPLAAGAWEQVKADAGTGEGVAAAVRDVDAVLSTLGTKYSRRPITIYSDGTRHIVDGMRAGARGRRLVVVSSGLTYPPPPTNWLGDHVLFPFLRNVAGRTLYADMRRMEEYLRGCEDIAWTVMRPGRLFDAAAASDYRLDPDAPTQGYTSRVDLAAAMVAELATTDHVHQAVSPTTNRKAVLAAERRAAGA